MINKIAQEAGIIKDDGSFASGMERIGGRGYIANLHELSEFARIVGRVARADERKKYEGSNDALSADDGSRTE